MDCAWRLLSIPSCTCHNHIIPKLLLEDGGVVPMSNELTTEQKLDDVREKLSQMSFIVAFYRQVLPKDQGDSILMAALASWFAIKAKTEPFKLPNNWVVMPGTEGDK